MPRLPLAVPITSRDGTLDKGAKLVNVYIEASAAMFRTRTRPGISTRESTITGTGGGVYYIYASLFVFSNTSFGLASTSALTVSLISAISNPNAVVVDAVGVL